MTDLEKMKLKMSLIEPKIATQKGLSVHESMLYWMLDYIDEDNDLYSVLSTLNREQIAVLMSVALSFAGVSADMVRIAFDLEPEFLSKGDGLDLRDFLINVKSGNLEKLKEITKKLNLI